MYDTLSLLYLQTHVHTYSTWYWKAKHYTLAEDTNELHVHYTDASPISD